MAGKIQTAAKNMPNRSNREHDSMELQQILHPVSLTPSGMWMDSNAFKMAQREATLLSTSSIVPKEYQGNMSNCFIALDMAIRVNMSPMMVMQNLYIINGRPSWSSQFIIALINRSGRYKTELQFEISGKGDTLSCYAWAEDQNGHKTEGPIVTMAMAKAEGWVSKNGSKWKTMPEIMIRYRAASFFGRFNCPDLLMGISYSNDEIIEGIEGEDYIIMTEEQPIESNEVIHDEDVTIAPETGEITEQEAQIDGQMNITEAMTEVANE